MSSNNNSPAIFFDSHPEEQDNYFTSWLKTIRTNLTIAATGVVERYLRPGELRLKWFTQEGNEGFKDFPLNEYEKARNEYFTVLKLPEVRRAMILGYPAQNPYIMIGGSNPWVDRFERERNEKEKYIKKERARKAKIAALGGEFLNIDVLLEETEREEEKRIQQERQVEARKIEEAIQKRQGTTNERCADEEQGLLSNHV